jgi:hypothetical protein
MTFRNPADPGHGPTPYRLANNPGDPARQDDGRDLDEIGKNENLIEQVPLELLEIRHHVLPDRERFDFCLPGVDGSAANSVQDGEANTGIQCYRLGAGVFPLLAFWLRLA